MASFWFASVFLAWYNSACIFFGYLGPVCSQFIKHYLNTIFTYMLSLWFFKLVILTILFILAETLTLILYIIAVRIQCLSI